MKVISYAALLCAVAVAQGCASITTSTTQTVSVQTQQKGTQVVGANCTLQNNKGTWTVTTPGSVVVHKSYGDMTATCNKDGMDPGSGVFQSSSNAGVWGNILAGGIIGYAVDANNGAGFSYPSTLSIEMGASKSLGAAPADTAVAKASSSTPPPPPPSPSPELGAPSPPNNADEARSKEQ